MSTVLLDKPMQNLYNDKSIDIEYFFTWANETWTRAVRLEHPARSTNKARSIKWI
ncbi:glycoside hydrolase family 99-like domain-containing protein [Escherichia coli]|uniref:glycoside hydrolase family 99-like domain-containing protein n=1 Tax=Escherichia coli TaxID=562 RepID=UPI003EED4464